MNGGLSTTGGPRAFWAWIPLALILASTALGQGPPTYVNPVYAKDFPDPFVLAHQGRYYAYGTQTRGTGFQLLESSDLVQWTPRELDFPIPWARDHYWAPEVFENRGRFIMTYSALDPDSKKHHVAVATADRPTGPFAHRAILVRGDDNQVGVIDAHIAVEAGKPYLIYSEETPRRIVARTLAADLLAVEGPVTEILKPGLDWERGVTEAPSILRRNRVVHLFYSAGPYEGTKNGGRYAIGHASGPSLLGPFLKDPSPLVASVEESVYGPGHQSLIVAPDGATWMLYHAWDAQGQPRYGQNPNGRTLRLDRLDWDGDTPRPFRPTLTPQPAPALQLKKAG